jgi:predicted CoA-binding protein
LFSLLKCGEEINKRYYERVNYIIMTQIENKKETVVIIGASNKPDRYSFKAMKMLQEYGHEVILINPVLEEIDGIKVNHSLAEISGQKVDTVTLYVNPEVLKKYTADLLALKPRRVIFNPGTESEEIEGELDKNGIRAIEACTLVMLRTGQF